MEPRENLSLVSCVKLKPAARRYRLLQLRDYGARSKGRRLAIGCGALDWGTQALVDGRGTFCS